MIIVPAWGTPDGAWTRIRDTWPGFVITFWGAGLRGDAVAGDWSLASDVNDLAEMIDEYDVVCGAGWAASTVLLAARARKPRLVVLYSPPIGTDLAPVAEQVRGNARAGRELMSAFGGSSASWDLAVQAGNFTERVHAYLTQRVLDAGADLGCPVVVTTPKSPSAPLPRPWIARTARPEDVAAETLDVLRTA